MKQPLCSCGFNGPASEWKLHQEPFPFDEFAKIVGGHNWVIARRSSRIVARYGEDVVCLSARRYREADRLARLSRAHNRATDGTPDSDIA
jgi:hypothetical protein